MPIIDVFQPLKRKFNPVNIIDQIEDLENLTDAPAGASFSSGDEAVPRTGLTIIDRLVAPAPGITETEPTSTDFSGVFLDGAGLTYDGGLYQFGGVNLGVLEFGLNAADGKGYAGGGVVVLDVNGIAILTSTDQSDIRAYKFSNGSAIYGGIKGFLDGTNQDLSIYLSPESGTSAHIFIAANADTSAQDIFEIDFSGQIPLYMIEDPTLQTTLIKFNFSENNADVIFYGTTDFDEIMRVDASQGYVGIGTASPAAKLHIVGALRVDGQISTTDSILLNGVSLSQPRQVIGMNTGSTVPTVPALTTYFATPYYDGIAVGTANFPWPIAGTIRNLTIRTSTAQGNPNPLRITLLVNNVASALTVDVPASGGTGSYTDSTHTVTIAAGDLLKWQLQNFNAAASCAVSALSMEIDY